MPLKVWNGSSWVSASTARVWNGSSWVNSTAAHVWNGSSWVKFFPPAPTVSLGNHDLAIDDYNFDSLANIRFIINSDGSAYGDGSGSLGGTTNFYIDLTSYTPAETFIETWLDSGSAGDVSVYVTKTGSSLQAGSSALNSYLPLSTTRYWAISAASNLGLQQQACTLSISLVETSNTSNVLDTATVTLAADAFSPN